MRKKITYKLGKGIINPRYVGLIRAVMPENYEIDVCSDTPPFVTDINNYFFSSLESVKNMELLDCVTKNDIYSIVFSELNLDNRTMLYFFFCVQCEKETDAVFTVESHAIQRMWLNGKMICLCGHGKRQIHTLHLSAGNNVFCFQQHDSFSGISTTFRLKSLEVDKDDEISFTNGNLCYQEGLIGIDIRYLEELRYYGEDYHFFLYPIDCVNLTADTSIKVQIIDHISKTMLYERECFFYELYTVPTSGFKYYCENDFNYLDVRFSYYTVGGELKEGYEKIYLSQPDNYMIPVRDRAKRLLEYSKTDEERFYIKYILSFDDEPDNIETFHKWERIEKVISIIERGEYYEYLRSAGEKMVCFYSDIDDTIDYYTVTLPKNYTSENEYPLIIINNVLQGTWLSSLFSRAKIVEAIVVDFSGKGVTMGSYVGDAAFNEIYDDVFSKFSIDKHKVIMMGHSNGGYASWAQAELTPNRYATIFPAVSEPNYNCLMNLSNVCVRYLTSESDYLNEKITLTLEKNALKHINDYRTLWVEKVNHGFMGVIQFNENVINKLIKSTSINEYPNQIHFRTDKNRYCDAYWINIHSIEYNCMFGEVHIEVIKNTINISAVNITGITITIPPQVDKWSGIVNINGQCFGIEGKDTIILHNKANKYHVACKEIKGAIYKGTGLIDPFIKAVRIISFLREESKDVINNFQTPSTTGFYGGTSVKYPILKISELDEIPKYNLVVLDNCTGSGELLEQIKSKLQIKMNKQGYVYLDNVFVGDYLIMQIVEHPTEPKNSILYINTNNEELYKKCLFTRKLTLPAYSSGYHPYLNSDAIIYDGKKYSVISEYGCEITEKIHKNM